LLRKNRRWNPVSKWKWSVMSNLTILANKLRTEAVFPEDFADVAKIDEAVKLLSAYNMQPDIHGKCPLCGSETLTEGTIENIMFNGIGAAPKWMGKIEGLVMRHCETCGAYNIEGW